MWGGRPVRPRFACTFHMANRGRTVVSASDRADLTACDTDRFNAGRWPNPPAPLEGLAAPRDTPPRQKEFAMSTVRSKSEYHRQTHERMERHFAVPDWSVREKLALACRMLAHEGHDSGLAGQLSARGEQPGSYWMLRFGLGLDEATPDNLLLVDDDLNVLDGDGMPNPSNRFHLWIYRAKLRVNSIMHTHPPYVSALSDRKGNRLNS